MSCCEILIGIVCTKRAAEVSSCNPEDRAITTMRHFIKHLVGWTSIAVMSFLIIQLCVAAFAQEENKKQDLGAATRPSHTGQTGIGRRRQERRLQKPGTRTAWETFSSEEIAVRFTGSIPVT